MSTGGNEGGDQRAGSKEDCRLPSGLLPLFPAARGGRQNRLGYVAQAPGDAFLSPFCETLSQAAEAFAYLLERVLLSRRALLREEVRALGGQLQGYGILQYFGLGAASCSRPLGLPRCAFREICHSVS